MMSADDGRPIGVPRSLNDYDGWLANYNTELEIQMAVTNCLSWINVCEQGTNPPDRVRGVRHWEYRLSLLKTKALLMGIQLEE